MTTDTAATPPGRMAATGGAGSGPGSGSGRARLGWIGAGRMGTAMAGFLLREGYPLSVYSRTAEHRRALAAGGAREADSPFDCAIGADVVFTCVSDDAALHAVVDGPHGLLAARPRIFVDTSTVSAEASASVARACGDAGVPYLRVPVSGNAASARLGQVTLLVSGPADAWTLVEPIVTCFSAKRVYLGAGEEARAMKLVINALIVNLAQAMAEALTLGRKSGLPWDTLLDAIAQSTLASPFLAAKTASLKARDFTPTMTARLILKDIDLMLSSAGNLSVDMPLTSATRAQMQALVDAGQGEADYMAAVKLAEARAGLGEP
jgi:3-hydroxyisobutyrate dehydrogenase-like beta-hydroxyacid dehydrogenase